MPSSLAIEDGLEVLVVVSVPRAVCTDDDDVLGCAGGSAVGISPVPAMGDRGSTSADGR